MSPELARKLHEAPRKPFTLAPLPRVGSEGATLKGTLSSALPPWTMVFLPPFSGSSWKRPRRGFSWGIIPTGWRGPGYPRGAPPGRGHLLEELKEAPKREKAAFRFLTPTVFATSKPGGRTRYTPLPDPRLIAGSLLDKWQAHSPFAYNPKEEAALRELFELDLEVGGFRNLRFHRVQAGKGFFPGFTGEMTLRLWSQSLEAREALGRLHALAFFSGVGAKTPYGMGLVVPL